LKPTILKTEAEGLQVRGQPRLHKETLSQKPNKTKINKKWSGNAGLFYITNICLELWQLKDNLQLITTERIK
jgi:hypothetical protein